MPLYQYTAQDLSTNVVRGYMYSPSRSSFYQKLSQQGLLPIRCSRVRKGYAFSLDDYGSFSYSLGHLLEAQLPLLEAIEALALYVKVSSIRHLCIYMLAQLREGYSLERVLKEYPVRLHALFVAHLSVAEKTGLLGKSCSFLGNYFEQEKTNNESWKRASRYPLIALGIISLAFCFLVGWVVPAMKEFLEPPPTSLSYRFLNTLSEYIQNIDIEIMTLLFCFLGLIYMIVRWSYRYTKPMIQFVPIWGSLFIQQKRLRFLSMLSSLIGSGYPLYEGLKICSDVLQEFRYPLQKVCHEVFNGHLLSEGLRGRSELFPETLVYLVSLGEKTGRLTKVIDQIYEIELADFQRTVHRLVSWVHPFLTLVGGLLLLWLICGFILPMYDQLSLTTSQAQGV